VTARLPRPAVRVLERGTLCYLAVRTPHGPHLTPVVYALDGGRLWLTTSRSSVKARALRRDRDVAGLVRAGDEAVAFRGRARTYDALDPLSWPFAAVGGPRLVRAATRFSLKNARFFAGYAVDARRIPLAWTPPGRVFVGVELASGALLDLAGGVLVERWGEWETDPQGLRYRRSYSALGARRALDLRVPRSVRSVVGGGGEGTLALAGREPTVLPVRWRRVAREGSYEAALPRSFLEMAGTPDSGHRGAAAQAALTVDRLASWRAAEMAGMLLQGPAEAFSLAATGGGRQALRSRLEDAAGWSGSRKGGTEPQMERLDQLALIRLRPGRVVWWEGWSSGSFPNDERVAPGDGPLTRGRSGGKR
jgi:pyridoxamine 5'-phosphate oxidase-like protein